MHVFYCQLQSRCCSDLAVSLLSCCLLYNSYSLSRANIKTFKDAMSKMLTTSINKKADYICGSCGTPVVSQLPQIKTFCIALNVCCLLQAAN